MKEVQAVLFDLDGVITDTAEYHYLAWKELANELGIEIDRTFNEQLKGVSRIDSLEKILEYGNRAQDFTKEEKEALATKKNEHYKKMIANITSDDLLPGVKEFLEEVKQANLKTGIASASKNAFSVIEYLQVGDYFDTIVDAAKVEKGKPDPEVFLKGADQLGVEYSACIGIEDAAAGVKAIKSAGMFAVGIGSETELEEADLILSSTEELSLQKILQAYEKHLIK